MQADEFLSTRETWKDIGTGMSNFDHSIEPGFEAALREGSCWGQHAAWNFNGAVWWADGLFHEIVWVYHRPQGIFHAESLPRLMEIVNNEFGCE